jgi:hypothetical protein
MVAVVSIPIVTVEKVLGLVEHNENTCWQLSSPLVEPARTEGP